MNLYYILLIAISIWKNMVWAYSNYHFLKKPFKTITVLWDQDKTLDAKVDDLINSLSTFSTFVQMKLDEQKLGLSEFSKIINKKLDEQSKQLKKLTSMTSAFSKSFGRNFELYNAAIVFLLENNGRIKPEDISAIKIHDPNHIVHVNSSQVDIDIFMKNPLVIGEVTMYLEENELPKIEAFIRTQTLVSQLFNEKPKSYFFTFGIHHSIEEKATQLMADANITLIIPAK